MGLLLYNSLSKTKEPFTPQSPPEVSLYTCGPTVYDYAHIGNLRTFIFYDIVRRTLEAHNWKVKHVMNITDVGHLTDDADEGDDKMEKGATREGKTVWEIADMYIAAFLEDSAELNLLEPTERPRATNHIKEQIVLIEWLEKNGLTYGTSDGVYFDTSRFPDYGKMARLDFEGMQEGARVEKNNEKRNYTDFALWKFSPAEGPKRAMEWDSPWGIGFPGWHLECSAMAMKYFGDTMDIHTGGVDHRPVHHTNEIAQAEGATGKPFARWWMHGEFLMVNDGRMGKSEGNFITLETLQDKGFDPLAYRYFVLGAHYRSKLNFSWEAMKNAQSAYSKLVSHIAHWEEWDDPAEPNEELIAEFMLAIDDDLNTPEGLAVLWKAIKIDLPADVKAATVGKIDEVLGLALLEKGKELEEEIARAGESVKELLDKRAEARATKNYAAADAIRDEIAEMGFIVEDTEDGPMLQLK